MTKTLIIKDYINEFLEFKTISICIIYKNLLITLVSVISTLNESLYYAYTPLFLCTIGCCSHCMCFNEVLPPSPSHCKWQVDGQSCCCTPPIMKYPPSQFTLSSFCWFVVLLMLLQLVFCVVCDMVMLYPHPLTCASWHAPKSLVSPKLGLTCSNCGIGKDSGHAPNFQH